MSSRGSGITFKEKLMQEYPDRVGVQYSGWCYLCPYFYDYEEQSWCTDEDERDCEECWNREMPVRVPTEAEIAEAEAKGLCHHDPAGDPGEKAVLPDGWLDNL